MVRQSRREFLQFASGFGAASLGLRARFDSILPADLEPNGQFSHSRIAGRVTGLGSVEESDDDRLDWDSTVEAASDDSETTDSGGDPDDTVRVDADPDADVVIRVWHAETGETVALQEPLPFDGGTVVQNPAAEDPTTVGMVYDERDDGPEYRFDLPVSADLRRRVISGMRASTRSRDDDRFDRSFDESGATVSYRLRSLGEPVLTFDVPHSLYLRGRNADTAGTLAMLPTGGDNEFDAARHAGLVDALTRVVDRYGAADPDVAAYQQAAVIAEFVQAVPHALDRESTGQLNYIRTPEELLVELTADCKDASLLLYHLYEAVGYDPVFVLLVGTDPRDVVRFRGGSKSDTVEYPNHLGVALPRDQLGSIPDEVDSEDGVTYDGEEYLYVESTGTAPPGEFPAASRDAIPIPYRDRHEIATDLIPLL